MIKSHPAPDFQIPAPAGSPQSMTLILTSSPSSVILTALAVMENPRVVRVTVLVAGPPSRDRKRDLISLLAGPGVRVDPLESGLDEAHRGFAGRPA